MPVILVITETQKQLGDFRIKCGCCAPCIYLGPAWNWKVRISATSPTCRASCVSLLGSQLAPEDIIGVPQIIEGKKSFLSSAYDCSRGAILPLPG